MPYIERDNQGHIIGIFANPQVEGQEFIDGEVELYFPPSVPIEVTRFQALAALYNANLLDQVNTLMASPQTPMLTKLAWNNAQSFMRDSPTVAALSASLNLTSQQVDNLFIDAAKIEA